MRVAFLGTPDFAVPVLRALVDDAHDVRVVVSRADRRRSRRGALEPSPVKAAAQELEIPTTERVKDVAGWDVELGVVVAFGRIIRPEVLRRVPMVNLHLSLLPRWRGAAPVQRAILAGDTATGVCLMALDVGLDTGPVISFARTEIDESETATALTSRLATTGTGLLLEYLRGEPLPGVPQEGEATYADKLTPADLRLVWEKSAVELHRVVRVGGSWCEFRGKRLRVGEARLTTTPAVLKPGEVSGSEGRVIVGTGTGTFELLRVTPEGRREVAAQDWLNGARITPEDRLR